MKERICESFVLVDGISRSIERYQAAITAIRCSKLFITDELVESFSAGNFSKTPNTVWLFTPDSKITKAHLAAFKKLTEAVGGNLIKGEREDSWLVSYGNTFIEILREDGFFVKELILG